MARNVDQDVVEQETVDQENGDQPTVVRTTRPVDPDRQRTLADRYGGFYWGSDFIGFAVATFFTVLFLGIVGAIIGSVGFDLSFVAAALYFTALHGRPRPADFGFRKVRPRLAITTLLVAAVGYYAATYAYASVLHLHGRDKLPSEFGTSKSTAALIAAAVFVCVLAPIAEEFFFRGFIFGALRRLRVPVGGRDLGTWLAAVLTGLLFGLAHLGSASAQYLVPLAFLGFVLCLIRWRTGSLYPCMALHCANNSLALGVNQLHWSAGEIVALIAASIATIAALTGPLATPRAAASR